MKGIKTIILFLALFLASPGLSPADEGAIYDPGELKPIDSEIKVEEGDEAIDFTLPAVGGEEISLSQYRGEKNVMLSFVPAAWTPVCSDQWPGYNIARHFFDDNDTIILGITTDNVPSQYSWIKSMGGLWFPVLSDFWPHGEVAEKYGILRGDGTAERATIIVDKEGIIRFAHVEDINRRPPLEMLVEAMEKLP
ncbi:alkyl hydroperoxide reductase/ Thiol specific antioxidant/ Mal allergen [Desulfonatronospira thiodismutans ASO3-1]|uniref:Alkyl hydroperoxide reductase/ Thiol specific antioxidant/ Mal allergen n=1 Tax=Desulfonatronospira thiodismutans ASO3-1 TaxID=555779 RepID=D6SQK2_9BACT|nr:MULTISPECIES: peroxiredoxin [Desulfonatronospira]EFI35028.1 alkyl hydroperoxide reductase/ Thiol specific antioxidant/ Mal allergen [Desulfonatronospira thiodismutans ASO3-1]RQD74942.1 MAG: peroxiredoxin [Desulfonatronospira sp. MSAO_Bac3]